MVRHRNGYETLGKIQMKYILATFLIVCSSVSAENYTLGNLTIKDAFAYPTNGKSGAGYFVIQNQGPEDTLIKVVGDYPRVMVHESIMENGVMSMKHRMKVKVPAGEAFEFKPGAHHVMFMGLIDYWNVDDEIAVTLKFETAGSLDIKFVVIPRP